METDTAPHGDPHLPFFITPPGQTDILLVSMVVFTLVLILLIVVGYLWLHALPERMAHHRSHTQLQLVGILTLLALFTHNALFWIAALLLVALQLPDFLTPINRMADALERGAEAERRRAEQDDA